MLLPCCLACTATIDDTDNDARPMGPSGGGVGSGGSVNGTGGGGVDDPGVGMLPGGVTLNGQPVYYRLVRLTHQQWENAARSALQLAQVPGLSEGFTPDPPNGRFSNNERSLYLTGSLAGDYRRAAEQLAQQVTSDAAALGRLGSAADSAAFIRDLGRAAFRRPLRPDEEQRYATLYASGSSLVASGNAFADGAKLVITAMLQSPNFVYRIELTPNGSRLSGTELASKLSFLLRDAPPDAALRDVAEAGGLDQDATLLEQARKLLADAAATAPVDRFFSQWFGLDRYHSILKDDEKFPSYQESVNASLVAADRRFFQNIFESGQGLRDVLTTRTAFVDALTAPFYGLSAPGTELSQVMLDESRPGFLTRLGFLAYNATLRDPDPIHRGVDISRRLLCVNLEPPGGEIPPLPAFMPGQTNRERVTAHTSQGACGACHNTAINPLGFAFEGFDAMGQSRTMDNGKPIDTSGQYAFTDGAKSFTGASELVALMAESQQAHGCFSANVAEFALARDVAGLDQELVTGLQEQSLGQRLSVKDSLLAVVQSKAFTVALGGAR